MTTDCIEINGRRRTIPNWIDNGLARHLPDPPPESRLALWRAIRSMDGTLA